MMDPIAGLPENVTADPHAKQLLARLSPGLRGLIVRLVEVMERTARQNSVSITKTELSVDHDPEDATEKIEIRQWVRAPEQKALDVWDKIGSEIYQWVNGLSDMDEEALTENVTFAVFSDVDDAAA